MNEYQKIKEYVHGLPCGCAERNTEGDSFGNTPVVHPNLMEILNSNPSNIKMNKLDEKRRKKLLHNIQSIKVWISKTTDFDESKRYEIVKELNKIARAFKKMAIDVKRISQKYQNLIIIFVFLSKAQPSLPDVFLWMICDSKRVAYARIQAEDLFFNLCEGDKGVHNGRVQTIFLKV
jgi:hypothetical protein